MSEEKKEKLEARERQNEEIEELGEVMLEENQKQYHIQLLSIIGEVEGHECLPNSSKTTKYEHVLPKLAMIEDSKETDGLLILLNTVGGDVEAGLAIAEMIASLSKPTVSLVLGEAILLEYPWRFLRTIPLSYQVQLWLFTRYAAMVCLSGLCRAIGIWRKSRTVLPDLLLLIPV